MRLLDLKLPRGFPITYRFVRNGRGWRVCVTAAVEHAEPRRDLGRRALGIDLTEHDAVVTWADALRQTRRDMDLPDAGLGQD